MKTKKISEIMKEISDAGVDASMFSEELWFGFFAGTLVNGEGQRMASAFRADATLFAVMQKIAMDLNSTRTTVIAG